MATAPSASKGVPGKEVKLKDRFTRVTEQLKSKHECADKGQMTINFGKKKRGQTFATVWETDKPYVFWFLSHCDPPHKNQRDFYDYCVEKIEELENEEGAQEGTECPSVQGKQSHQSTGCLVRVEETDKSDPDIGALQAEVAYLKAQVLELTDTMSNCMPSGWMVVGKTSSSS